MIITTSGKPTSKIVTLAKKLSSTYNLPYRERLGVSIERLKEQYQDDIVIVTNEKVMISPLNSDSNLFFHPNLAMVRAKRIMKGEQEPLVSAAKLKEGMSFLDCTLGLASDSIIASLVVGPVGKVTGIEGNMSLYLLAREGLASFSTGSDLLDGAMRRIEVIHQEHLSFLQESDTESFDVVYLDPMFEEAVNASNAINSIRNQALMTDLSEKLVWEAERVAKERVVLKDHWKSKRFAKFGFTQYKRKTSLFHYGTIEKYST